MYFSNSMKDLVSVLSDLSTQGVASKWFLKSARNRGQQFGEFAFTRKQRLSRRNIGPGRKKGEKSSLSAYGTKRKSDFGKNGSES